MAGPAKTGAITGGCQCGAVRYAFHLGELEKPHLCHCRMCQKATGGLFAALAGGPKSSFEWTKGEPGAFSSSSLASRCFCRDCGTPLSFSYDDPKARLYVTIGSLDEPEPAKIEVQYGVESRISWVELCPWAPDKKTAETAEEEAFFAAMVNRQA